VNCFAREIAGKEIQQLCVLFDKGIGCLPVVNVFNAAEQSNGYE